MSHFPDSIIPSPPHQIVSSITNLLTYISQHQISLQRGNRLTTTVLRHLTIAINQPDPKLRTAKKHPLLATYLTLLHAADLIAISQRSLYPTITLNRWLSASQAIQRQRLIDSIDSERWQPTLALFGFQKTVPLDLQTWLRQQLSAPFVSAQKPPLPPPPHSPDTPISLPSWLTPLQRFTLLQYSVLPPFHSLHLSPITLHSAHQRRFDLNNFLYLLILCFSAPVPNTFIQTLKSWHRQGQRFQVEPVALLTTETPAEMDILFQSRRLSKFVHTQISPRHTIVNPKIVPSLKRKLAKLNQPLSHPDLKELDDVDETTQWAWVALRVLMGLCQQDPYLAAPPHRILATYSSQLNALTYAALNQEANYILQQIDRVMRGKNEFEPAPPDSLNGWIPILTDAIRDPEPLAICYLGVRDEAPRWRTVEPLRLEQPVTLMLGSRFKFQNQGFLA